MTQLSGREAAAEAGVADPRHVELAWQLDERGAVAGLQFHDAQGVNTVVLRERPTASGVELLADHVAVLPQTEERQVLRGMQPYEGNARAVTAEPGCASTVVEPSTSGQSRRPS